MSEQKQCPFCPVLDPEHPDTWTVTREGCEIGGVGSCLECTIVAAVYDEKFQAMLLSRVEQQKEVGE
jgi:hypothetical protein